MTLTAWSIRRRARLSEPAGLCIARAALGDRAATSAEQATTVLQDIDIQVGRTGAPAGCQIAGGHGWWRAREQCHPA